MTKRVPTAEDTPLGSADVPETAASAPATPATDPVLTVHVVPGGRPNLYEAIELAGKEGGEVKVRVQPQVLLPGVGYTSLAGQVWLISTDADRARALVERVNACVQGWIDETLASGTGA